MDSRDPRAAETAGGVTDWIGVDVEDITANDRFWAKVDASGDCWEWTAAITADGYGNFSMVRDGRKIYRYAHRLTYQSLVGEIPAGLVIDHLCRNRKCVNPAHLEPVTDRTNIRRGAALPAIQARQTHCVNGHEFDDENTYVWAKEYHRSCRACGAERARGYRAKSKAA